MATTSGGLALGAYTIDVNRADRAAHHRPYQSAARGGRGKLVPLLRIGHESCLAALTRP